VDLIGGIIKWVFNLTLQRILVLLDIRYLGQLVVCNQGYKYSQKVFSEGK